MRGRSTLILILVLAALGGYIYFVENKKPETSAAETKAKLFTDVSPTAIDEIQVKSADGQVTKVAKSGEAWKVVEPVQADADSAEVSSMTTGLNGIEISRVLDENPGDLKPYGLDPPRIDIQFRNKGQMRHLFIGERTPTGEDVYAKLPEQKRVVLIPSFNENSFNKGTFALRDKRILTVDRAKVDGLELVDGANTFQFTRNGMEWKMVKPVAARADYGQIEGLVERLVTAQMQALTAEVDADLKKYGLDKPTTTMTVSGDGMRTTLSLGKTENAVAYAKDSTRSMIFTVAPTLKTDVIKDVADYRRKDLFDSRSFTATRLDLHRGTDTIVLEKKMQNGKDVWLKADGKPADPMKVDSLLAQLTALRAQSFEPTANAALGSPALVATIAFDTNKMETVTIARSGTDVVAARADEGGTAKLDAAGALDEVMKAIDAVK